MRHLTNEEIERVYAGVRAAQISLAQLDTLCDFRKSRMSEAVRLRRKLSDEEIARVFSNLKCSQAVEADRGQKMLCTRCKKRLTEPGQKLCPPCSGSAEPPPAPASVAPPANPPADPRLTPIELASRIEHCMQELSRQGKRIISVQTDLDDRVSALAQALAAHDKSKAVPVSAAETPRDPDIIVSFVNFERVCRQMYAKCPHLFAATVRRAAGMP